MSKWYVHSGRVVRLWTVVSCSKLMLKFYLSTLNLTCKAEYPAYPITDSGTLILYWGIYLHDRVQLSFLHKWERFSPCRAAHKNGGWVEKPTCNANKSNCILFMQITLSAMLRDSFACT